MGDFLTDKRNEIAARLKELKPLVEEYARLEAADVALAGVNGNPAAPGTTPRPRASRSTGAKRGRPKGTGTRAAEALALVQANPGIEITEIAAQMKIKPNYLYRVLPGLAEDGKVFKKGQGWHPTTEAAA